MKRRLLATWVALCAAIAPLAACGSDDSGDSGSGDSKVVYLFGTAAPNLADSVWFAVGQQAGFFKEQGVTVEGLNNDGSSAAIKALVRGAGDVAVSELPNVIGAASTGVPIQAFSNFVHRSSNFIGVLPGSPVTEISQLEGKTVGVPSVGSGSQLAASTMLREAGVDTSSVKFVAVGAGATVPDALNKGEVDAVCSLDLHFKTLGARTGLEVRYLDRPAEFDTLTGALFVRRKDNSDDENDAIDRFTRAAWESILFTLANPQKAVEMAYEVFPDLKAAASPDDASIVSAFYEYVTPPGEDWKTVEDWAGITVTTFDQSHEFAEGNGLLVGDDEVTYGSLVDPSSFDAINDFDQDTVLKKAAE